MSIMRSAALVVLICSAMATTTQAQTAGANQRKRIQTTVKPLDLRHPPTTEEIMAAGQLGGALHPTHDQAAGSARDAINLSFGAAMEKWNRHEYRKAAQLLKQHVKEYPKSPWVSEAILHLGCDAQYNGRYLEAQKHFERILKDNQGSNHAGAKALLDKANLRLGVLKAFQNNLPEARNQFRDLYKNAGDWRERTYAGHWIQRISRMKRSGKSALNCGNQALAALLKRDGRTKEAESVLKTPSSSDKGQSIRELEEGSQQHGYPLVAKKFATGQADALAAPAIVHLPAANRGDSGHYWLFEGKEDGNLQFYDPQAGKHFVQTADEFSEQWDGIALVTASSAAGTPMDQEQSKTVFGGCCGVPRAEEDLGCPEGKCKQGPSMNGGAPNGAPAWTVNMVNMNFYMTDIPLWYQPPIGPSVEIQLSYNSQSAIALNEPFGNKWQFNYSSYLVVDTAGEVTVFMPDGRRDVYRPNNPSNPNVGYQKPYRVFNDLKYIASNRFELTFPEGIVYTYAIPANTSSLQPFLVEIRDTYGNKLSFGYDSNIHLTTITDAASNITRIEYSGGLVSRVTDPFGRHADFTYDGSNNLVSITDMGGYSSSFTYDENANLTGITNGGGTWQVYIEPADGVDNNMVKYPAPGAGMWENYRTTITNPQGGKEEYYYDGYSGVGWYKSPRHYGTDVKTIAYDYTQTQTTATGVRGELASVLSPEGVAYTFDYDGNGQIIAETDGHGDATFFEYNSMGKVTQKTLPNLQTISAGYAANGIDVTSITNGLGSIQLAYNANRSISSIRDRMGAIKTMSYNTFGQPLTITNSLTPPVVTAYTYDDETHVLTQVSRNGSIIEKYTHDTLGRVTSITDATGVTLTFEYNDLDDITKISWPDNKSITLTYSTDFPHLMTAITDRTGQTTSLSYDSLKHLTRMTDAAGGISKFSYDKDGNLIVLTSPNGGLTRFYYNNDNQLKTRIEADGSRTSFQYDSNGLLKTIINGRSATMTYSYDSNHNLTGITFSDGTPAITYTFDVFDRLTGMNDAAGAHQYSYDANSRLTSINGPLTNDTISYSYDSEGRRTGISVQGGLTTTRTYDALNRLTRVANTMGAYDFGYPGSSPKIANLIRPNGSKAAYVYDSLARLTSLTHKTSVDSIISAFTYAYNTADQRATETITGGTAAAFSADSTIGYSYDTANNLISSSSPTTFSYDGDGNMTAGLTPDGFPFTAQYDAMNQLISFEYTDGSAVTRKTTYGYNGFGYLEAIDKFANNSPLERIRYVRDEALVYQEQSTVSGQSDYTWGLDFAGGIGGLLGLKRDASSYSYLYDGKGNVTSVIDNSTQTVAAGYTYDPFGVLLQKSGSLEQPYRYSTKTYDEDTGLSYFGYRHYSPVLGRWLTRDPSGLKLYEMNLNAFVRNNPVNLIDPFGLDDSSDNLQKLADQMASRKEAMDHLNNNRKDLAELAKVPTGAAGAAGYLQKLTKLNKVCKETIETREKFEKAYEERRKEEKAKQEFKKLLWEKFRIQYSEP